MVDKGEYYFFPGYPALKCTKHMAGVDMAALDYARVLQGRSPLFNFYSTTRENYFEARLRYETAGNEFRFEYETPNPPTARLPRNQFIDYLKIVYPTWQFTPQKLQLCTLMHVEYMTDADGKLDPRAVMEFIKVDKDVHSSALKNAIVERMRKEGRAKAGVTIARELGVKYFLVLHTRFLTSFSLYNFTEGIGWQDMNTDGLQDFYLSLTVTK